MLARARSLPFWHTAKRGYVFKKQSAVVEKWMLSGIARIEVHGASLKEDRQESWQQLPAVLSTACQALSWALGHLAQDTGVSQTWDEVHVWVSLSPVSSPPDRPFSSASSVPPVSPSLGKWLVQSCSSGYIVLGSACWCASTVHGLKTQKQMRPPLTSRNSV